MYDIIALLDLVGYRVHIIASSTSNCSRSFTLFTFPLPVLAELSLALTLLSVHYMFLAPPPPPPYFMLVLIPLSL